MSRRLDSKRIVFLTSSKEFFMRIDRRMVLALAAGLLSLAGFAQAQEWSPSRPVRIIVPIVGSTNDVLARIVAPKLQEALGQPWWWRTSRAPEATSVPTSWPRRRPMATRC
jgi:hypothetical protein